MDEGTNTAVASDDRTLLIQAYERARTFRARTLAADALWLSLTPQERARACATSHHHCGPWLQEVLGPIDERLGFPALNPSTRYNFKILLTKEIGTPRRQGRNVDVVWEWLDQGVILPGQLKGVLDAAEKIYESGEKTWELSLREAQRILAMPKALRTPAEQAVNDKKHPSKAGHRKKGQKFESQRLPVHKTLQFKQFRRILDDAPAARDLPVPEGVDVQTYREAYSELLENVRLVLEMAGRAFFNAKRRHRKLDISVKSGVLAHACRTLRVPVPALGEPVDYFNSRRRWLEIVKECHPDRIPHGTPQSEVASKVTTYTAANEAFAIIQEYKRKLEAASQAEQEASNGPKQ